MKLNEKWLNKVKANQIDELCNKVSSGGSQLADKADIDTYKIIWLKVTGTDE